MPQLPLSDAAIYYQEYGHGAPLILLHAGWGLGINGFAYQQDALADEFRMIVPDRRGYGRSTRVEKLEADFHWQAALDMFALLDAQAYTWFSKLVVVGELLIGIALTLCAFIGIAAFFVMIMSWK